MKLWWLVLLCAVSALGFGAEWGQRVLQNAKAGDYIVAEANRAITLLSIRSIGTQTAVFEEISAPLQNLKNRPSSWAGWVKERAPGHTSWSMFELDLKTGEVLECYSFSRGAWIQLSEKENLLSTLLHLPLREVPKEKRRKIGPAPLDDKEPDLRKVWSPPFVFEGEKRAHAEFDVYETEWPKDGSELSGREVLLYFDKEKRLPLPTWIQVQTSHLTVAFRMIDAGKNLPLVYRNLPRRVPEFVGLPLKTEKNLTLNLRSPKYYKKFELYAVDVTTRDKQIFPIVCSLIEKGGEAKTLVIDQEELERSLEPNHRYTWLLVPAGHSESYTEMSRPFLFTK